MTVPISQRYRFPMFDPGSSVIQLSLVCTHLFEMRLSIVRTWYSCDSAFHCLNPSLSDPAFHCPNLVRLRFSFPLSEPITSPLCFPFLIAVLLNFKLKCFWPDLYSCMLAFSIRSASCIHL